MKKFEEKTVKTEKIYKGKIIDLQVDEVELPNGKTSKRELIKHPGAVAVIALTQEGKLVMVEQYRKALEKSIIEIPAGKLEPGEEADKTALRELEEETGYGCGTLDHLISFYTSPGFADELVHIYVARDIYVIEESREADEDEFVELIEVTVEEAEKLIEEKRIYDAKTAYAVQYLKLQQLMK
ncbi:NUDIX hydrolase [Bacillus sp. KH172YL63]|uniref:NUDIX hydrolase n=1 Tax=Bacillus sp. KH172YL63 TaxID=2709784 RepID=UPI0013E46CC3|nr:NUDIX hydrolase [Bacillus sp. KH172YL63]BCB04612.1 ADP-ribose pyrophosphatase [Bacillus sp. KH172YL63]